MLPPEQSLDKSLLCVENETRDGMAWKEQVDQFNPTSTLLGSAHSSPIGQVIRNTQLGPKKLGALLQQDPSLVEAWQPMAHRQCPETISADSDVRTH